VDARPARADARADEPRRTRPPAGLPYSACATAANSSSPHLPMRRCRFDSTIAAVFSKRKSVSNSCSWSAYSQFGYLVVISAPDPQCSTDHVSLPVRICRPLLVAFLAWASVLSTGAAAGPLRPEAGKPAISPRYHAKPGDVQSAPAVERPGSSRPLARWYQGSNCRYQLRFPLKSACGSSANRIANSQATSTLLERGGIVAGIESQITRNGRDGQWPQKTRILLRLGIGLAIAYVLFLSLWFWVTRGRMARGRPVRF